MEIITHLGKKGCSNSVAAPMIRRCYLLYTACFGKRGKKVGGGLVGGWCYGNIEAKWWFDSFAVKENKDVILWRVF